MIKENTKERVEVSVKCSQVIKDQMKNLMFLDDIIMNYDQLLAQTKRENEELKEQLKKLEEKKPEKEKPE